MPSAFAFGAFAAPVGFAGAATATDAFVMGMSVWKPESAGLNGGRERVGVSRRRWGKPGKKVVLLPKNQETKNNAGAGGTRRASLAGDADALRARLGRDPNSERPGEHPEATRRTQTSSNAPHDGIER